MHYATVNNEMMIAGTDIGRELS